MEIVYLADRLEFLHPVAQWHREEWGYLRPEETLEERISKIRARLGRREIPTIIVALEGDVLLGSAMLLPCDMDTRPNGLRGWLAWWSVEISGVVESGLH